jgi:hypothetical protein
MSAGRRFAHALSLAIAGAVIASSASADESRVLTFNDGPAPKLGLEGSRLVRGSGEIEVRFVGIDPLCYAYSVSFGVRAMGAPPRAHQPAPFAIGPAPGAEAVDLGGAEGARTMLSEARLAVERAAGEARTQGSLDPIWAECDAGAPHPDARRQRLDSVASLTRARIAPNGEWRKAIERALTVSLAVRAMSARMQAPSAKPAQTEDETKRRADDAVAARELGLSARALEHDVRGTLRLIGHIVGEAERAQALLARAPGTVRRHVSEGKTVTVTITRTRLRRGLPAPGDPGESFESPEIETLSPILLDIGAGPSLTFRQTEAYGLGVAPLVPEDDADPAGPVTTRVVRTEEELNFDGVVAISVYLWGRRYLDDGIFNVRQLLPRPMVGLSMRQPFSSIYVGGQIDPIQFVDISVGARWFTRERLVGPQPGEPALRDERGNPAQPVVQDEFRPAPFVSLTFSTDLVHRWIKRGL